MVVQKHYRIAYFYRKETLAWNNHCCFVNLKFHLPECMAGASGTACTALFLREKKMASLSFELTRASWRSLRSSRRLTHYETFSELLRMSKVAMRRLRIFHMTIGKENSAQNGGGANCAVYSMLHAWERWLPSKTRPDKASAHITFRVENLEKVLL